MAAYKYSSTTVLSRWISSLTKTIIMKVGILGSSDVGQTLGNAFLSEGYEVMIGTRDTSKETLVKWQKENPSGKLGSFAETATFGDFLVLAMSGDAAIDVVN